MLEIKDLHATIHHLTILRGVTLQAARGEVVGVIGPNGSGKTTLFNTISGFVPVTSGSIVLNAAPITHLPAYQRARQGLGRVFQNSGVFRDMTVLENMVTALESRAPTWGTLFPWSKLVRRFEHEARELLGAVGLAEKAHEKAGSLSGGQLRLLEIQRTLAFGAEVLLLDEPTAGVSPRMKDDVADLIRSLQAHRKTILIIEHDLNFIQSFCDRIVVLNNGQVALDDSPAKVRQNPQLQDIYFGRSARDAATA